MISYTTPTYAIRINTALPDNCNVYVTFERDGERVTVKVDEYSVDATAGESLMYVDLTQAQTGGLVPGRCNVQANIVDSNGYRAATKWANVYVGGNLITEVLQYDAD